MLASIANASAWFHGASHTIQNEGGDLPQQIWFLGSTPYALLHMQDPFLTSYVFAPHGANLLVNTAMFLPALIVSPVTLLAGPVAAFNVLMVIAIAGSAIAAYSAFRRWVEWEPAAFAGGLLYGFSPYMVGAAYGHLNVLILPFPPLLLILLDEILVRQRTRPIRIGIVFGLLVAGQFFTSTDVLASSAVMATCGLALVSVFGRRRIRSHLSFAVVALSVGAVVSASLCAYPLWLMFTGPGHINGPIHSLSSLARFSSDLVGFVFPTANQLIAPSSWQHIANEFVGGDFSENGTYLGIPLLVVTSVAGAAMRKEALVKFAGGMAVISLILSLGPRLRIDGHVTVIRLPFVIIRHMPLLQNLLPVRFVAYAFLFGGLILAVAIVRMRAAIRRSVPALGFPGIAALLLAIAVLVPLIPRWPYPATDTTPPLFFRTSAVRSVKSGSILLPVPFPSAFHDQAMTWQALDGFRFRMPGGYMLVPGNGGVSSLGPVSVTQALLEAPTNGQPLPPISSSIVCAVQGDLRAWRVDTIVVTPDQARPFEAVQLFTAVLGASSRVVAGSNVYYDVQDRLADASHRWNCR